MLVESFVLLSPAFAKPFSVSRNVEMNAFKIYKKSEKFVFTRALISFTLLCVILIFGAIYEKELKSTLIGEIIKYSLILLLIFGAINSFLNRQLKGKLEGLLILNLENIIIDERKISIEEIKFIKIELNNYKREYIGSSNPVIFLENFSNGTNNKITIKLNSDETIVCYFQRETSRQIMRVHDSLRNYLDLGILSRKNYDEITK